MPPYLAPTDFIDRRSTHAKLALKRNEGAVLRFGLTNLAYIINGKLGAPVRLADPRSCATAAKLIFRVLRTSPPAQMSWIYAKGVVAAMKCKLPISARAAIKLKADMGRLSPPPVYGDMTVTA